MSLKYISKDGGKLHVYDISDLHAQGYATSLCNGQEIDQDVHILVCGDAAHGTPPDIDAAPCITCLKRMFKATPISGRFKEKNHD